MSNLFYQSFFAPAFLLFIIKNNFLTVFCFSDYLQTVNPHKPIPSDYTYPRAAVELFAPYSGLINCRINVVAWECGMEGADSAVTAVIAHASQVKFIF